MNEREQARIGVCVCECGQAVTSEVAERLVADLSGDAGPVLLLAATDTADGEQAFARFVRDHDLDKVIAAGGSPARNQARLERLARAAGLTSGAVTGVNLHSIFRSYADNADHAFEQADRAIRNAAASAALIPVFEVQHVPLEQRVLVIGGGIAGLYAAGELHRLGYAITLVEQAEALGGQAIPENDRLKDDNLFGEFLSQVEIFTESVVADVSGQVGRFTAHIRTPEGLQTVQCGAIVVASGALPAEGSDSAHIFSLDEIDLALADLVKRRGIRTIGLVLDRDFDETKASAEMAFSLAKRIQLMPRYQVYLFCRDVRVAAKNLEAIYDDVRAAGVNIVKYGGELAFSETAKGVNITCTDTILQQEMTLACDRVGVSSFGVAVAADAQLAALLGITTDAYGQMQANNIHLFPGQTNRPGMFVVGSCHGQHYVPQIITEAKAVAQEIHTLLAPQTLDVETSHAVVDPDKCVLCLTCIRSCPHKAMSIDHSANAAASAPEACRKCGICAGECPAKAITLPAYSDEVLLRYASF